MTHLPSPHPTGRPRPPSRRRRVLRGVVYWLLFLLASVALSLLLGLGERQRLPRDVGVGLAPDPAAHPEAVVQVYGARTLGLKGSVSVHTWIATKRAGASTYRRYEIIGWRLRRGGTALAVGDDRPPDGAWYGNPPDLLLDLRGPDLDPLIDRIEAAVAAYPFRDAYTLWPGPNSNTFTAYIGRAVPELGLDLPATAIGKDYRPFSGVVGRSPSGTGLQATLWGVLGLAVGLEEGVELNVFSLNVELDLLDGAIELPALGRFGFPPVDVDS